MADGGRDIMADDTLETPAPAAADAPDAPAADAAELTRQRDDYYDRLLRKTAEFDNYRKRTDRERQQLAEAAAADLIKDLLPLLDDLERALKADAGSDVSGIRRGVELIHRQMFETLRKRGVTPIEALGQDFDPHFHNAVAYEPAEGRREGEVIEEFARGYMLGDRLLRPAMVKVAKG
ncbi:MAG TPA: nucleotide exchange factor GrpE [Vicinamibacterales bacterium]|nr:nucleotide exchange factor GrpE [Vicinamibacterales bacterium]